MEKELKMYTPTHAPTEIHTHAHYQEIMSFYTYTIVINLRESVDY